MPEVELQKDPLGAGRGKTLQEQAGISFRQAKKRIHEKYYIPPYRPTNRNWEMTFASLGYKRRTVEKFWRIFCRINRCSGAIQLEHFLEHFDLDWTPWTERCFGHFDTTGGGDIDFLEFMISVWNVCTFKNDSLSNFTFDMYDLDCDGELSIPEIETMVKELFGEGGGQQCSRQAIEFAEARGGALNLNSFIAFTGSHQLLLFPVFQIQRKLQRRVLGIRFWDKVERAAKENFDGRTKNEFNPRHVQILLRTYQTGGAAAVLSHTGDPNKGLRDWYVNKKGRENKQAGDEVEEGNEDHKTNVLQGWNLLKGKVTGKAKVTQPWGDIKKNILNGQVTKQFTLERIRGFKPSKSFRRKNGPGAKRNTNKNSAPNNQANSADLPVEIAKDLARIRARRAQEVSNDSDYWRPAVATETNESNIPNNLLASAELSSQVANDLKRIRARRASEASKNDLLMVEESKKERSTSNDQLTPASLPANAADDLERIRAKRAQRPAEDEVESNSDENSVAKSAKSRPARAELPANVMADLQRIRAKHAQKSSRDDQRIKAKPKGRARIKSTAVHNNVRQRQAGSIFFKSDTNIEKRKGWLE